MAFTQEDIDAIDAAIASGELTVTSNGRTVTYRSINELMRARAMARAELDKADGRAVAGPRKFTFTTYRGH